MLSHKSRHNRSKIPQHRSNKSNMDTSHHKHCITPLLPRSRFLFRNSFPTNSSKRHFSSISHRQGDKKSLLYDISNDIIPDVSDVWSESYQPSLRLGALPKPSHIPLNTSYSPSYVLPSSSNQDHDDIQIHTVKLPDSLSYCMSNTPDRELVSHLMSTLAKHGAYTNNIYIDTVPFMVHSSSNDTIKTNPPSHSKHLPNPAYWNVKASCDIKPYSPVFILPETLAFGHHQNSFSRRSQHPPSPPPSPGSSISFDDFISHLPSLDINPLFSLTIKLAFTFHALKLKHDNIATIQDDNTYTNSSNKTISLSKGLSIDDLSTYFKTLPATFPSHPLLFGPKQYNILSYSDNIIDSINTRINDLSNIYNIMGDIDYNIDVSLLQQQQQQQPRSTPVMIKSSHITLEDIVYAYLVASTRAFGYTCTSNFISSQDSIINDNESRPAHHIMFPFADLIDHSPNPSLFPLMGLTIDDITTLFPSSTSLIQNEDKNALYTVFTSLHKINKDDIVTLSYNNTLYNQSSLIATIKRQQQLQQLQEDQLQEGHHHHDNMNENTTTNNNNISTLITSLYSLIDHNDSNISQYQFYCTQTLYELGVFGIPSLLRKHQLLYPDNNANNINNGGNNNTNNLSHWYRGTDDLFFRYGYLPLPYHNLSDYVNMGDITLDIITKTLDKAKTYIFYNIPVTLHPYGEYSSTDNDNDDHIITASSLEDDLWHQIETSGCGGSSHRGGNEDDTIVNKKQNIINYQDTQYKSRLHIPSCLYDQQMILSQQLEHSNLLLPWFYDDTNNKQHIYDTILPLLYVFSSVADIIHHDNDTSINDDNTNNNIIHSKQYKDLIEMKRKSVMDQLRILGLDDSSLSSSSSSHNKNGNNTKDKSGGYKKNKRYNNNNNNINIPVHNQQDMDNIINDLYAKKKLDQLLEYTTTPPQWLIDEANINNNDNNTNNTNNNDIYKLPHNKTHLLSTIMSSTAQGTSAMVLFYALLDVLYDNTIDNNNNTSINDDIESIKNSINNTATTTTTTTNTTTSDLVSTITSHQYSISKKMIIYHWAQLLEQRLQIIPTSASYSPQTSLPQTSPSMQLKPNVLLSTRIYNDTITTTMPKM